MATQCLKQTTAVALLLLFLTVPNSKESSRSRGWHRRPKPWGWDGCWWQTGGATATPRHWLQCSVFGVCLLACLQCAECAGRRTHSMGRWDPPSTAFCPTPTCCWERKATLGKIPLTWVVAPQQKQLIWPCSTRSKTISWSELWRIINVTRL